MLLFNNIHSDPFPQYPEAHRTDAVIGNVINKLTLYRLISPLAGRMDYLKSPLAPLWQRGDGGIFWAMLDDS